MHATIAAVAKSELDDVGRQARGESFRAGAVDWRLIHSLTRFSACTRIREGLA